ncbi:hypothetical protein PuT2_12180 [Pusillimonas sp. T2]|uniref:DUF192 domain-containing protein n=1 Tax=Pusillimonas sp. T2 TaxID=1548123 RepID=UPI000B9D35A7|nr:DUF192 domain-containing protein [Pusillimonas sp. T2]OXR48445.1 hypothetical protein PuT2_12180 [Pusillimonas sp. T2]
MLLRNTTLGLILALCTLSAHAQTLLPVRELTIKSATITAEVAATPEALSKGLMHRPTLPPNHGMLFVFNPPTFQCFWMKNTFLPLSIAFIDSKGVITRITDMRPLDETAHCPPGDIAYALEMAQGWFRQNHIGTGDQLSGLPD